MKCQGFALNLISALLIFTLVGCLPDSFTKYEEEPATLDSGATGVEPPGFISYDITGTLTFQVGEAVSIAAPRRDVTGGSFSVSPSLPSGVILDSADGSISGSSSTSSSPTDYTITYTNSAGSQTDRLTIAFDIEPTGLVYEQSSSLILTVGEIEVFEAPDPREGDPKNFTTGGNISSPRTVRIDNNTTESTQGSIIFPDVEGARLFVTRLSGVFSVDDPIDNTSSFSSEETVITAVENSVAVGAQIDIEPYDVGFIGENVIYTIDPDLPDGITINNTSGRISGSSAVPVRSQEYTVSAANSAGETTITFSLSVVEAPQRLSYTKYAVVTLDSNSAFLEGDRISSRDNVDETPPEEQGDAIVREVLPDGESLYVEVRNGVFQAGQIVDRVFPFSAKRGEVESVRYVSGRVTLSDPASNTFCEFTDPTCTSAFLVRTNSSPNDIAIVEKRSGLNIYVRIVSGKIETGNLVNITTPPGGSPQVDFVDTPIVMVRTNGGTFTSDSTAISNLPFGNPMATSSGTNAAAAGTFLKHDAVDPTDFFVVNESLNPFSPNEDIDNRNPFVVGFGIQNIASSNIITIYRDKPTTIFAGLQNSDTDFFFNVSPDLPTGLTLDPATGHISGAPEVSSAEKTYTITAVNAVGTTTYDFNLKVFENFSIEVRAPNPEEGSSYILSKAGEATTRTECSITEDAIDNGTAPGHKSKKILCSLNAGELDLNQSGMKITVKSGPSLCQFVRFKPYYFWGWQPDRTFPSRNAEAAGRYITEFSFDPRCGTCEQPLFDSENQVIGTGLPIQCDELERAPNKCIADYGEVLDELGNAGPNCDTGKMSVRFFDYAPPGGTPDDAENLPCTYADATKGVRDANSDVECGGNIYECREGAAKDVVGDKILEAVVFEDVIAHAGISKEYDFSPPTELGFSTNIHLANFTNRNSCVSNTFNYHIDGWQQYADNPPNGGAFIEGSPNPYTDPFLGTNPFYRFECLDSEEDVKAEIYLVVKDFDISFRAINGIENLLNTSNMDVGTGGGNDPNNDKVDWDNFIFNQQAVRASENTVDDVDAPFTGCGPSAAPTSTGNSFYIFPEHSL